MTIANLKLPISRFWKNQLESRILKDNFITV